MKLDIKALLNKISPMFALVIKRFTIVFAGILVLVYGFLVIRIGLLSRLEPSPEAVDEAVKDIKRPRIDKDAVAKIYELRDQNIQVQTLFQQARDNPFSE